tara:strand:- start:834 stop:1640 length:807 start_codon:yes stop_codon:yes gene_type:complete
MTPTEWAKICSDVADAMTAHTRPFATPLLFSSDTEVNLVGSGSFVMFEGRRILLTCEHVRAKGGVDYLLDGSGDDVPKHPGPWEEDGRPSFDVAIAGMSDPLWNATRHNAIPVPYERFAPKHQPVQKEELMFFRGFAGENARYAFGVHEANGTGYCSQEKQVPDAPDPSIFEIFWEPQGTKFAARAIDEARRAIKFDDPGGFSGSLVWNTRYLECQNSGLEWTPDYAVVTGLLRRWDTKTKTLIVWRVENLRAWLEDGAVNRPSPQSS